MKNLYLQLVCKPFQYFLLLIALLFTNSYTAEAQIRKNFTQRSSQYTPTKKIYNVKGDFTMLGNTCLTPQNYSNTQNNNGQFMTYVDTDNDPTTFNSSSSTLVLSTENGAVPACSNIVYAGLYWTGKSSANATFDVTKTIPNGTQLSNLNYNIAHNQSITNTNYSLSISRNNPSSSTRNPIYTFNGNGNSYIFNFYNSVATNRVTLKIGSGAEVSIPVTVNTANTEATLVTPYTIIDGAMTITIYKLIRNASTNLNTSDTQNSSNVDLNVTGQIPAFTSLTKSFNKRVISLKGPSSASYTQFTASTNDIYYPSGTDDNIFSGYVEITDYVRTNGIGEYFAADMALLEGNVGGTGYSGGWGMIIVYENAKMKYRDVTIFDGYAYVNSGNTSGFQLPVSGFNTVQSGDVGVKLGLMASEGDVSFTGDYFQIQKNSDSSFLSLSHSNNTSGNFFNSSINSGTPRNPQLNNSTGLDLAMFNVPNTNNEVIGNSQTSTNFKYGTSGDTYSIFAIAMAVDAYIPEAEGILTATTIGNIPVVSQPYVATPGQEIGFNIDIRNTGSEAINNYKVIVPIPYNATYVAGSAVGTILFSPFPTPNNIYFDPLLGGTGSIVWDFGTLPLPVNPSTLLAKLTFKLAATTDCSILSNATCGSPIVVNGSNSGTGSTTGISFSGTKLIQGYTQNGNCLGQPIPESLAIVINGSNYVQANCIGTPLIRNFSFCNAGTGIGTSEIASFFPPGSMFYNEFPVTINAIQYSDTNPIPLVSGSTVTYYAVPSNNSNGCNFAFTVSKCPAIVAQNDTLNGGNGTSGNINIGNVLNNNGNGFDTLNGVNVLINQVTLTVLTPANSINGTPVPFIDPSTGQVTVLAGTAAGTYTIIYEICELNNNGNCDPATVTITVTGPGITANNDLYNLQCSNAGNVGNILENDILNLLAVNANEVNLTLLTGGNSNIILNTTTGDISILNGIAVGQYILTYKICQKINPNTCSNASITINILDNTPPVLPVLPNVVGQCSATVTPPTASDLCSDSEIIGTTTNPLTYTTQGTYVITWTFDDGNGNISSTTQTVIVDDTTNPVIPTLTTVTGQCSATVTPPTTTDNCGNGILITGSTSNPLTYNTQGTYTIVWNFDDGNGNSVTANQTVIVDDTTNPVIPTLTTVTGQCSATVTPPTTTDNCGNGILITGTTTNPLTYNTQGTYTVVWNFDDGNGNSVTANQTVIVDDTTNPVFPVLTTVTGQCSATVTPPTTTDGCDNGILITGTTTNPLTYNTQGTYTVVWNFNDGNGNSVSANQTVIVDDTTNPVIPTLETITDQCSVTVTPPSTTDNCGNGALITGTTTNPLTYNTQGTYTIVWNFNDGNGNSITANQTVIVDDTTNPVIPTLETITGQCSATVTPPTTTDNCGNGILITGTTTNPLTYNTQGTYTVVWNFNDGNGNSVTANQTVIVDDTTNPVIPTLETITGQCSATVTPPTTTDGCGNGILITGTTTNPLTYNTQGTYTVVWNFNDGNGNNVTANQTVIVDDTIAPIVPILTTITSQCSVTVTPPTTTDLCSDVVIIGTTTNPLTYSTQGTFVINWTFNDGNGNSSTTTQTVIIDDTVAPSAPILANVTGQCSATANVPIIIDGCNETEITGTTSNPLTYITQGTFVITWTFDDGNGNIVTAQQNVIVDDTIEPVIATLPQVSSISCPATPIFIQAIATDNCSVVSLNYIDVTVNGNCAGSYSIIRTWTATDIGGNTATASQTINVQDLVAPVIAALPETTTIACTETPVFATATATDECNSAFELTFVDATVAGACAGSYATTRTWTATDACGNTATASQTINVQDLVAPVIAALPETTTIACTETPVFATATATDECNSAFELTFVDATVAGACAGSYATTRTWTATDACGNTATASQTINVQDLVAPVIAALPETTTIACTETPVFATATATDECNSAFELTFVDATVAGACAGSYATTRTWTATDACGNTATASQTINVQDLVAPVIAALPETTTIACTETPVFATATATDECNSAFELTFVDATVAGACAGSYATTRTWTATDACGNTATASQTINVQDLVAPVIAALPETTTIACTETPVFATATATDECNSAFELTFVDATVAGACAGSYATTRTWTATDACGNTATASQTINVQDLVAPVIAALPETTTIACTETPVFATATATDECNSAFELTFVDATVAGACAGSYATTRTWTATDACGNTATASQTINVQDLVAPVIAALPETTTIACTETPVFATATATDECNSAFELTFVDATVAGACAGSYATTRTWTATDACGNTATASQTINVQDLVAPVIAALPETTTIACTETPVFATATATDECNSAFELTFVDATVAGACAGSYATTRTWTATDACGNTATASQTINVQDLVAPVIAALPETTTIACTETPVFATATATDECNSAFELTFVDATVAGACAGSYATTRTWTATDACGNTATASQTINVQDLVAPVIAALPETTTIACTETPVFATATATDECNSAFELTFVDATVAGACAGSYATTRTWTATDACGNTATASQTINVQDLVAPVIAALPETTTIACTETPVFATATATDECNSAFELTFVDATVAGACAGSYDTTRTWTATDACGNTATASQTINVQDLVAPVIAALPETTTIACTETPVFATATATDECNSAFELTFVDATVAGACAGSYATTRTWTATDACGNTATASQTINVQDLVAPVIAALPETTTIACTETPVFATATATDECNSAFELTFVDATVAGACAGSYATTRTWTATDACGNTATASQTINVQDLVAPVIAALPETTTIACTETPVFATATATDECNSAFELTFVDATVAGACAGSYATTRTWTATDACGNTATASQTINVQDLVAPVIAALPETTTIACTETPVFATATATDECNSAFELTFVDATVAGACAGSYATTRTWTATDACGNTATASQTINVQDLVAPVIAALPETTTIACTETPVFATATATDECNSAFELTFVDATVAGACAGSYATTRTWTATDACGNTATASQTINVQDTTPPTITVQATNIIVQCDGQGNETAIADWLANNGGASATETCSTIVWSNNFNALANDCSAAVTVIFTATDLCGNFATTTATFTVQDSNAPVAPNAPDALTVACAADVPVAIALTATDDCNGNITTTGVDTIAEGDCANSFVITRTWTFTDACGNTATASQSITVDDTIAPVIAQLPGISTISCPVSPEFAQAIATDNCISEVQLTFVDATVAGACAGSYATTRTWTATDACGNTATASQTINVQDLVAPVIAALPETTTIACTETPVFATATATDECNSAFELTFVDATVAGACAGSYATTRTWTATDACGNTATASQTINVQDLVAPVIAALPETTTIACTETPVFATATATDECNSAFELTFVDATVAGACAGSYATTRTWTATDACGNTATASQTINVQDLVAPVIAALPETTTIACTETPVFATATATDECNSAFELTFVDATVAGACAGSYATTRTWTATDACGNTATASQTINVQDLVAPVIAALPETTTIACTETPVFATATATDECNSAFELTFVDATVAGACAGSYATTRTWTATDACGNTATASQTINVQDLVAPVIAALPETTTIACTETPVFATATATDECNSAFELTFVDATVAGACAGSYATTRTWTATDACGNTATASQTINVIDNALPVFVETIPASITVSCDAIPTVTVLTATDNCSAAIVEYNTTTTNVLCPGSYTITRTWTATDACGNATIAEQIITVLDIVAPTFDQVAPINVTVACDAVPTAAELTATDTCGTATVSFTETTTAGTCPSNYIITRTWIATDTCGNDSAPLVQTITVTDVTGPALVGTLEPTINVTCDAIPEVPVLVFTDNCSTVNTPVFTEVISDIVGNNYTITWTWIVTDACNNESTFVQNVNVSVTDNNINIAAERCNFAEFDQIDLVSLLPVGTPTNGTWINVNGVGGLNGSVFNAFGIPIGDYVFSYQITEDTCPRTIDITMNVNDDCRPLDCDLIIVHNAFTPNGDGTNEWFQIDNINDECHLPNSVEIYNRWGVLVYEAKNYDNEAVRFNGISEGRATVSKSAELPAGTYFYILQYSDTTTGKTISESKYLYLTR